MSTGIGQCRKKEKCLTGRFGSVQLSAYTSPKPITLPLRGLPMRRRNRLVLSVERLESRDTPAYLYYDPASNSLTYTGDYENSNYTTVWAIGTFVNGGVRVTTNVPTYHDQPDYIYGTSGGTYFNTLAPVSQIYLHGGGQSDILQFRGDTLTGGTQYPTQSVNVIGGPGDDRIRTAEGDDQINASDGSDTIEGGGGNDWIVGDSMASAAGPDLIFGEYMDVPQGFTLDGNDSIWGGEFNDVIFGQGGDDSLNGGPGNDVIYGEAGNDFVFGDVGNDSVLAGAGDDTVWGWDGNDTLEGGNGNDVLSGGLGSDHLYGEAGDDTLQLGYDPELGGDGDGAVDYAFGGPGVDEFFEVDEFDEISQD